MKKFFFVLNFAPPMHRRLYILFLLFAAIPVFGQNPQENSYKLAFPYNISSTSSFDISVVASNPSDHADKLDLYFSLPERITFHNLELRSFDSTTEIPCRQIASENADGSLFKAKIDFSKNRITSRDYFQLIFTLKADNAESGDFKLAGIFKSEDNILGYLQSSPSAVSNDTLRFSTIHLKFYKPQRFAGNALELIPGGEFSLTPDVDEGIENLLAEFWIKLNDKRTDFLSVINKQTGETLLKISTNQFQMITFDSESSLTRELINPYFISRGNWYHISLLSSFNDHRLKLFCGNTLVGSFEIASSLQPAELQWILRNESRNKSYQVDVLRFLDFNDDIEQSFINKNYLNFISANSRVIYQYNFDSEDEFYRSGNESGTHYNSVNFVKSDAPIFARAPEINIDMPGNVYELTWSGGDYKQARTYILEKSVNNTDFISVSSVEADNSYEKNYTLLDAKDPSAEIVYYRIKQINKDGSEVFSSQVKIGQGKTEPFIVEQNYPNPFNPRTSIVVDLLEDTDLEITVYNLEGKEITKLYKGFLTSGTHKFSFDASELSSGVYLYKVSTPRFSNTKKMILTK